MSSNHLNSGQCLYNDFMLFKQVQFKKKSFCQKKDFFVDALNMPEISIYNKKLLNYTQKGKTLTIFHEKSIEQLQMTQKIIKPTHEIYNQSEDQFDDSNFCFDNPSQMDYRMQIVFQQVNNYQDESLEEDKVQKESSDKVQTQNQSKQHFYMSQNDLHSSSQVKQSKNVRQHLSGKRRPRGSKNKFQRLVKGYWTKNFLQFGKNPHFQFIKMKKGKKYIQKNIQMASLHNKKALTLSDYEELYKTDDLQTVWKQFFQTNYLYRALMISRTEPQYKQIFVKFIDCYKKAFKEKKFIGISRILSNGKTSQMKS